ncbi:heterokaryon incompatibility protein-domain-containing protein [Phaeosphaeria sp. MPI-PUGE-AT-0046c]|nr:heterokaryon incompatibility protein-domain-containing protein [Phaeosphaeria sp. MPI-PUGE-AT-0046c]
MNAASARSSAKVTAAGSATVLVAEETFIYSRLTTPDALRLLKVQPGTDNGLVKVKLWEATEAVPYRCLSYMWGDQTERYPIVLNGKAATVGRNLLDFLQMAEHRFPNITIWVDAVCINQTDDEEKSIQVQRMGDIFANATEVLCWLGNDAGLAALLEWAGKPRNVVKRAIYHLPVQKTPRQMRANVEDLYQHPYWRRAWIQQEIILAQSIRLLCGHVEVEPAALKKCKVSMLAWMWTPKSRKKIGREQFHLGKVIKLLLTHQRRIIHHMEGLLINNGIPSECFDPRDRIYALLALALHGKAFKVDYSEGIVDLFFRALWYFPNALQLHNIEVFWDALRITPEIIEQAVQKNGKDIALHLPMRRIQPVPDRARQLKGAFNSGRTVRCTNLPARYHYVRASIDDFHHGDILLCRGALIDRFGIHAVVHPIEPTSEDHFTLSVHAGSFRHHYRLPSSKNTELWSMVDGVHSKVTKWSEVLRIADLGPVVTGYEDTSWYSTPYFELRTTHHFFIAAIEFAKSK